MIRVHSAPQKVGVLLINLGTPDRPTAWDVGRYLREFLMDPFVVDISWLMRTLLVHLIIIPFRSFKSAKAYQTIWTSEGSPLRTYHLRFAELLQKRMSSLPMAAVMRYGNPSIRQGLKQLRAQGVEQIVVWPLYPQWAWASTASSLAKLHAELQKMNWQVDLRVVEDFFDHPQFITAFVRQLQAARTNFATDYTVFSFHGIPERHLFKKEPTTNCFKANCCDRVTDQNRYCYRAQCFATARKIAEQARLQPGTWEVTFQSRLGRTPWIQPFTDIRLKDLAQSGRAKRVLIVCPSFVADCLETLEEITVREREAFIAAGGEDLKLVPSLNDTWTAEAEQILQPFLRE